MRSLVPQNRIVKTHCMQHAVLFKRFFGCERSLQAMSIAREPQWFALSDDYGATSYGKTLVAYEVRHQLRLIDLGTVRNRKSIAAELNDYEPSIPHLLHPDEQYSGAQANARLHKVLQHCYGDKYDGTIIVDRAVRHKDLEGPTEVVLWNMSFCKLQRRPLHITTGIANLQQPP
jgi:hypothetical protein